MDSSQGPQRGTVADRIRAFQDTTVRAVAAPKPYSGSRVLTQASDFGVSSGHGRRKDASFASPASRAARDGNDSLRGDGRPPVGPIVFKKSPVTPETDEQRQDPQPLPVRPVTSLERPANEHTLPWPPVEDNDFHSLRRRYRSMENVADSAREIVTARSRLRSVLERSVAIGSPQRERTDTLAELGHMLDDAIENQSSTPGVTSVELGDEAMSRPHLASHSQTSLTTRHRSPLHGPDSRQDTEKAEPRNSDEPANVDLTGQSKRQLVPLREFNDDRHDTKTSSIEADPRISPERQFSWTSTGTYRQPDPYLDQKLSPVKQRMALFESLALKPSEHEQICQHFPLGRETAQGESHKRNDTRRIARIKSGGTIEERPATPLIPLILPTKVSTRQTSRATSWATREEQPDSEHTASVDDKATEDPHRRISSMSWPFKWNIFNKSPSAPPQEARPAPTGIEARSERYPGSKPGAVQSIVHDLRQAADGKDDVEPRRSHSEKDRVSRRPSRAPPLVTEVELAHGQVDLEDLKPANVPPLQMPIEEEVKGLGAEPKLDDTVSEPRTPLQRAMTEKQVMSPLDRLEAPSELKSILRKPEPRTPVRGRSTRSTHRLSVREHGGIEQRFNLSPGSSRSTSRKGRAGVKVEVEVRDSPEREARDKGEKIVIIRANVEPVEDE